MRLSKEAKKWLAERKGKLINRLSEINSMTPEEMKKELEKISGYRCSSFPLAEELRNLLSKWAVYDTLKVE